MSEAHDPESKSPSSQPPRVLTEEEKTQLIAILKTKLDKAVNEAIARLGREVVVAELETRITILRSQLGDKRD